MSISAPSISSGNGGLTGGSAFSTLSLRVSLEGGLTLRRGLSFVAWVSFLAFWLASISSSTCDRLGGGAGGESEGGKGADAEGLYIVLELLSLFCKALNFSLPVSASISSKEVSPSKGGEGGVADIVQS